MTQRCSGIPVNVITVEISSFIKLFLFLYADDTILFADNERDLKK